MDFAQISGLNIVDLIASIVETPLKDEYPLLSQFVDFYYSHSDQEWFESEDQAQKYYLQDEVFSDMIENGLPKLNYNFGVKLLVDNSLRREFLNLIAFNIKKNLPNIKSSVIDDVAKFSCHRILNYPLIALNETLELTSELDQVLKKYIPNLQIKEKSTHINVCFNDDQEK